VTTTKGQRIGVIVSVIWFLGFGFYLWNSAIRQNEDWYSGELQICMMMNSSADERQCSADSERVFLSQVENNEKGLPLLAGIDLAAVGFGWLCTWIVIALAPGVVSRGKPRTNG